MPERLTLDLERITLGEMMDVELASGVPFLRLVRSKTGLTMTALYLRALQRHAPGTPLPSWDELRKLTPLEASRFVSQGSPDSPSTPSDE